jgi:hypothetical protein
MDAATLADLERLARAATPGPWHTEFGGVLGPDGDSVGRTWGTVNADRNAAFIAQANPKTVLALIEEVRALRGKRALPSLHRRRGRGD